MLARLIRRRHKYQHRGSSSASRKEVIPTLIPLWPRILLRESGRKEVGCGLGTSRLWKARRSSFVVYTRETGNSISEFNYLAWVKLLCNVSLLLYLQSMVSLAIYDWRIFFFLWLVIRLIWLLGLCAVYKFLGISHNGSYENNSNFNMINE